MDVEQAARQWLDNDPDPQTRAELDELLAAGDVAALTDRFGTRLEFGTAGIRGPLGAGPARMNRVVVRQVTAGLASRLQQPDVDARRGVVVGHDARHKSATFAEDAAAVLAGAGIPAHVLDGLSPTPLVAFAVRDLDAAAGIQITASHNPAGDNGYKLYWSDGAQILEPLDDEISAAIAALPAAAGVTLATDGIHLVDSALRDRYVEAVLPLRLHPEAADLRVVYTPLHGVAGPMVTSLLARAGFSDVSVVGAQAAPDPDFPTVRFPNPEEPGALDLAFEQARAVGADLVIANDPDGDRIATAVPTEQGWRPLNGDEIGCLLAEWLLSRGPQEDGRVVATTVVSSRLLAAIAAHHGVEYAETLTGFKWLGRIARDAAGQGRRMVLAYEQALGAMCGTAVLDKDGISAALVLADMGAALKSEGRTPVDLLDDLARRHGVHMTAGRNVRLTGPAGATVVTAVLEGLRDRPPTEIDGVEVVAVSDHLAGVSTYAGGQTKPLVTPPTNLVGVELADRSRLQVRPSGTEPLLKFYVEVVEPVLGDEPLSRVRGRARSRMDRLVRAFMAHSGV